MEARKVLEIINLFGSAENFIGGQFAYLREAGYEMHLICSPDEKLESFARNHRIQYKAIELSRQIALWKDLKALVKTCKYIRKNKIDTVIGHQTKGRLIAVLAAKIMRVPHVIIFAHGAVFETATGLKRKVLIWESRFESKLSDRVVCVSEYIRNLRINYRIDDPAKQYMLGKGTCGGIDTKKIFNSSQITAKSRSEVRKRLDIGEDDFIVGFSGRLVRDKGIIELLEGIALLKKRHEGKSIKLLIIGYPEMRDSLPDSVLSFLKSSEDIIYTGRIDHEKMGLYYSVMSVLVLPSHREGFGLCNIEAQAMGIPVLTSSKTGCVDSIIDGQTGFYIDNTPMDICNKMELLLLDPDLRTSLGAKGKDWVTQNFDHAVIWPEMKKLLDSFE